VDPSSFSVIDRGPGRAPRLQRVGMQRDETRSARPRRASPTRSGRATNWSALRVRITSKLPARSAFSRNSRAEGQPFKTASE